jgi:hypothetical protein
LAEGDPDRAKMILEAEDLVAETKEAEPRAGVVQGLKAVIEADNQ